MYTARRFQVLHDYLLGLTSGRNFNALKLGTKYPGNCCFEIYYNTEDRGHLRESAGAFMFLAFKLSKWHSYAENKRYCYFRVTKDRADIFLNKLYPNS